MATAHRLAQVAHVLGGGRLAGPGRLERCAGEEERARGEKQCEGTNFGFSAEECSTLFFMTSSSRAKPAACYEKADPCETLKPKPADCDPKVCKEARECIAPYEL